MNEDRIGQDGEKETGLTGLDRMGRRDRIDRIKQDWERKTGLTGLNRIGENRQD